MNKALNANEFPALSNVLYFNAAYMGPYPQRTQAAILFWLERFSNPSALDYRWVEFPERVRAQLAQLLGVSGDQFSINSSTGEAVSFYANGCEFKPGDRVALFKEEYPSDVLPWMFAQKNRGLEIDFYDKALAYDIPALMKKLHAKTRFLNLSSVEFQTGNRADIVELGHHLRQRDVRFIVDVTQALGGMKLTSEEIEACDLMVCSTYKWLLAPYGQAFAYWSKRSLAETVQTHGNWLTQPKAPNDLMVYSTDSKPGARRFDRGQAPNILGMKGLEASLSLFQEIGLAAVEKHNLALVNHFLENMNRDRYELVTKSELRSAIVCLRAKDSDSAKLQEHLRKSKVDLSVREGNLRISFHLFNTTEQVDRLLQNL
jgi:selenocysteine lyase/cysteine desulfurase